MGKNLYPDPGSGMNIPDHFSESLETNFWVKNTEKNYADPDPGSFRHWIRDGKIRIRDKHPRSATRSIFIVPVPLHAEAGAEAPEVERDHLTARLEESLPPLTLVLLAQVNLTTNGETTV
jgi:hypothetical protein